MKKERPNYLEIIPYLEKVKKGNKGNVMALCPFHNDKNPSMSFNTIMGVYKCFSCGAKGNYYQLLEKLHSQGKALKINVKNNIIIHHQTSNLTDEDINYILSLRKKKDFNFNDFKKIVKELNISKIIKDKKTKYILPTSNGWNKELTFLKGKAIWINQKGQSSAYVGNIKNGSPLVICEGEWDLFLLYSMGINAITFTNGSQSIPSDITFLKDKEIIIIYDMDEPGQAGTIKLANILSPIAKNIKIVTLPISGTKNEKDLTDYFYLGNTKLSLKELIKNTPFFEIKINKSEWKNSIQKINYKAEFIIKSLENIGDFFYTPDKEFCYFDKDNHKVLIIDRNIDFKLFINSNFGVNAEKNYFNALLLDLQTIISETKKERILNNFTFYNKVSNILYIYSNKKKVFKLTDAGISEIENGDDDVFFRINKYDEIIIDNRKTITLKNIFQGISFSKDGNLSVDENLELLETFFFSLFFSSLQRTKPFLIFNGEAGSGKSFALKMIIKILFGDPANILIMPSDEKDLQVVLKNNIIAPFDNIDNDIPKKIKDTLASISTNVDVSNRKLYTNDEVSSMAPRPWIAITSRTDSLKRDDLLDRAIVFYLSRIKKIRSENYLIDYILKNRPFIWSYIITVLLEKLKKFKNYNSGIESKLRMADFYIFGVNFSSNTDKIFNKLAIIQKFEAVQNDSFFKVIEELKSKLNMEKFYLIMERDALYKIYQSVCEDLDINLKYRFSKGGMLQYLTRREYLYSNIWDCFVLVKKRKPIIALSIGLGIAEKEILNKPKRLIKLDYVAGSPRFRYE